MKLAHLADCHLGFRTPIISSTEPAIRGFERAVQSAMEWADGICIAGDLFHSVRTHPALVHRCARTLQGKPVLVIGGNHDSPAVKGVESPLHLLQELAPVQLILEPVSFEWMGLRVNAIPARYVPYWTDPIDKGDLLVMHGVHPFSPFAPPRSPWTIPIACYDPARWRYIALGDLHEWHSIPTRFPPNEYYAGATSLCTTNIWSEQHAKGYLRVEMETGKVQFVPIPTRAAIAVQGDDPEQVESEVCRIWREGQQVGRFDETEPIVQITAFVPAPQVASKRDELQQAFKRFPFPYQLVIKRTRSDPSRSSPPSGSWCLVDRWIQFVRDRASALGVSDEELLRTVTARGLQALGLDDGEEVRDGAATTQ